MYFHILNVLILLTWLSPTSAQSALQAAISQVNPCSENYISRSAAFVGCGATDYACQCQHDDAIIGPLGKPSPQGACLFHDCGRPNAAGVRSAFNKICNLVAAASSAGNQQPSGSQVPATNPTTTPVNTPTPTPTVAQQSTPSPSLFRTTIPSNTPTASETPSPGLALQTTEAQDSASITLTTQAPPADTPIPTPSTYIAENTPATSQSAVSVSVPAISTPPLSTISSSNPPFSSTPSLLSALLLSSIPSLSSFATAASAVFPNASTSTTAAQASSLADSTPLRNRQPHLHQQTNKRLPPAAIAGIAILIIGFTITILSLAFIQLRRRKRKSYMASQRLDEKPRPMTEDGPPSTQDGIFSTVPFPSPPSSVERGLPWDGRGKYKISSVMGVEIGPRPKRNDRVKPIKEEERNKSRGKEAGESGNSNTNTDVPRYLSL